MEKPNKYEVLAHSQNMAMRILWGIAIPLAGRVVRADDYSKLTRFNRWWGGSVDRACWAFTAKYAEAEFGRLNGLKLHKRYRIVIMTDKVFGLGTTTTPPEKRGPILESFEIGPASKKETEVRG